MDRYKFYRGEAPSPRRFAAGGEHDVAGAPDGSTAVRTFPVSMHLCQRWRHFCRAQHRALEDTLPGATGAAAHACPKTANGYAQTELPIVCAWTGSGRSSYAFTIQAVDHRHRVRLVARQVAKCILAANGSSRYAQVSDDRFAYRPPRCAAIVSSSWGVGLSQSAPLKNRISSPVTIGCFHPLVSSRLRIDGCAPRS